MMDNFTTEALQNLLSTSLPILCKNALSISDVYFSIEALVGVSVGGKVVMASIKEVVGPDGKNSSYHWQNDDGANQPITLNGNIKSEHNGSRPAKDQAFNSPSTPIYIKQEVDPYNQHSLNNDVNQYNNYLPSSQPLPVKSMKRPGMALKGQVAKAKLKKFPSQNRQKNHKIARAGRIDKGSSDSYNNIVNELTQQAVDQSMSMEMSYVCHICQARRNSKASLVNHIRGTHLSLEKYECNVCGEKFKWFMQLHRHRKKFHEDATNNLNNSNNNPSGSNDYDDVGGYVEDGGGYGGDEDDGAYGHDDGGGGYGDGYQGDGAYGDDYGAGGV